MKKFFNSIKNRINLLFSKLLDGSRQQIAVKITVLFAIVAVAVYAIINFNITPGDNKDGLVSVKEAQSKTDLQIMDDDVSQSNNSYIESNTKEPIETNTNENLDEPVNNNTTVSPTQHSNIQVNDASKNQTKKPETNKPENNNKETSKPTVNKLETVKPQTNKQETTNQETNKEENESTKTDKITCTIEIRCDRASENIDLIDNPEIQKYVPSNGVILAKTSISINKECSVYEVLTAITAQKGIHLDATYNKMYKSAYINGINHLYEKDVKSTSGWVYQVNGKSPSVGCGTYTVEDGDSILWAYSVEGYGEDI